jgi:radical SAM superfamily enzyme YgiQ (UPF0313 family)
MSPTAFLLHPPHLPGTTANRHELGGMGAQMDVPQSFVRAPLLLATAAAVLQQAHWQVTGLDAAALGLTSPETLRRLPPADVLILQVSHATLAADRAFLHELREHKPLLPVIAIGPALRYPQVAHGLNDLVDLAIAGEPELALATAARRLLAGDIRPGESVNPYTLAQSAYSADGMLVDLDQLPFPAWQLFVEGPWAVNYPLLAVLSSRGCPAGCGYCAYVAAQDSSWRSQSPARTANELAYLARRFQAQRVAFWDPVFAHDRNRVLALCSELRHRQLGLAWECESRPEHFDGRLLRAIQAAGCTAISLGLESADPELLVAIGRVENQQEARAYLDHIGEVVESCRQLGLICRVYAMVGLPGQTRGSVELTAAMLQQLRLDRVYVRPYEWHPGIRLPQVVPAAVEDWAIQLSTAANPTAGPGRRRVRQLIDNLRSR